MDADSDTTTAAGQENNTDHGVRCIRCDYDLRGVSNDAVCPECGLAVSRTLADRHRLEDCPPQWVRRLSVGVGLLTVSALWAAAVWTSFGEDPFRMFRSWGVRSTGWLGEMFPAVQAEHWITGGLIAQLVGVWLVTSAEPGRPAPRRQRVMSWAWRLATVVTIGGVLAPIALWRWVPPPPGWMGLTVAPGWWVWVESIVVAYALCPLIGFWRLRWLAERVGRPKLADYAGVVGIGLAGLILHQVLVLVQDEYVAMTWELFASARERVWPPQSEAFHTARTMAKIAEVAGPTLLLLAAAAGAWLKRRSTAARGFVLAGAIWFLVALLAVMGSQPDYTRSIWKTVAVVALPTVTTAVFYAWAVFLLARMTVKFWQAARAAERAWRDADRGSREPG